MYLFFKTKKICDAYLSNVEGIAELHIPLYVFSDLVCSLENCVCYMI